jgi:hypothetical protein
MERPSDDCPYPKPFPPDFADCPAFQPRQFIPLDTLYQPLEPVMTCRHLETRTLAQRHRYYAACALGDAEARRQWAKEVGSVRLGRIRALQRQLGTVIAAASGDLWKLKGQQLRAYRDGRDATPVTAELKQLAGTLSVEADRFLVEHAAAFAEVDMPIDAARQLIHIAVDRFIQTQFASEVSFEVPDDVLQSFPEPVRTFFRPTVPQAEVAGG